MIIIIIIINNNNGIINYLPTSVKCIFFFLSISMECVFLKSNFFRIYICICIHISMYKCIYIHVARERIIALLQQ